MMMLSAQWISIDFLSLPSSTGEGSLPLPLQAKIKTVRKQNVMSLFKIIMV